MGTLGNQHLVLACIPGTGMISAAAVAADILCSFKGIKVGIAVGICGVATAADGAQILLGEVIISTWVIRVDFGRQYPNKFVGKVADIKDLRSGIAQSTKPRETTAENVEILRQSEEHGLSSRERPQNGDSVVLEGDSELTVFSSSSPVLFHFHHLPPLRNSFRCYVCLK